MIGLVLVTHGRLAHELRAALEHIVGPQERVRAVAIGPEDDIEDRRAEILAAVEEVDAGAGVILLTDMFGGTPSNLAMSVLERPGVEVVAGVNLPMLVKLARVRESLDLAAAAEEAMKAGRKYIQVASRLLAVDRDRE